MTSTPSSTCCEREGEQPERLRICHRSSRVKATFDAERSLDISSCALDACVGPAFEQSSPPLARKLLFALDSPPSGYEDECKNHRVNFRRAATAVI